MGLAVCLLATVATDVFFKPGRCGIGGLNRSGYLVWRRTGDRIECAVFAEEEGPIEIPLPLQFQPECLSPGTGFVRAANGFTGVRVEVPRRAQATFSARVSAKE